MEKVPGGQSAHAIIPFWPQVPAGHATQPPDADPTYPAAQLVQADWSELPACEPVERPVGQAEHPDALNVPLPDVTVP